MTMVCLYALHFYFCLCGKLHVPRCATKSCVTFFCGWLKIQICIQIQIYCRTKIKISITRELVSNVTKQVQTLLKTNSSPLKITHSKKESSLPTIHFSGALCQYICFSKAGFQAQGSREQTRSKRSIEPSLFHGVGPSQRHVWPLKMMSYIQCTVYVYMNDE